MQDTQELSTKNSSQESEKGVRAAHSYSAIFQLSSADSRAVFSLEPQHDLELDPAWVLSAPHFSENGAALAIGIGLQNFPEGTAVSMPLRREGMGRMKSFFMGQASGAVEPVAGVIGALFVLSMQHILPYALCFAAGAMIFVVVEELIPESQKNEKNRDLVTIATMVGFTVMMILDVALG